MKHAIIFRSHLLPYSNTFISEQMKYLVRYRPLLVGTRRVREIDISNYSSYSLDDQAFSRLLKPLFPLYGYAPFLYKNLDEYAPQVIHAHFGSDAMMALHLRKRIKVPLVSTFHGYDICVDKGTHYNHQQMIKHFDKLMDGTETVIAVSDYIKMKLISRGAPENKIKRHYIGVDMNNFNSASLERKENSILFVGRLVEKKGCQYLLKAFKDFSKKFPDYRLVIIGDGPLRSDLEKMAKAISNNIVFKGAKPFEEVIRWMGKSKIFCVPSITADNGDTEALGLVFAEAQASYTPVVSFASGGIPEVVSHEKTGFLGKEKDFHALSDFLQVLAADEKLRINFAKAGKKHIESNHNLEVQTQKLEAIYDKSIELYP